MLGFGNGKGLHKRSQTGTNGHKVVVREITNHLRRGELSLEQPGFGKLDLGKPELEVPGPRNPNPVKLGLQLPKNSLCQYPHGNQAKDEDAKDEEEKDEEKRNEEKTGKQILMHRS